MSISLRSPLSKSLVCSNWLTLTGLCRHPHLVSTSAQLVFLQCAWGTSEGVAVSMWHHNLTEVQITCWRHSLWICTTRRLTVLILLQYSAVIILLDMTIIKNDWADLLLLEFVTFKELGELLLLLYCNIYRFLTWSALVCISVSVSQHYCQMQ